MPGHPTQNGRGTKRPRSESRPGGNANGQRQVGKRRVQAEILAPGDVKLRVGQDGSSLRIERTDFIEDDDDMAGPSWFAMMPNRGVVGQGNTELIRRQLDVLDAMAPGAVLEFAIHPAAEPAPAQDRPIQSVERKVVVLSPDPPRVGHLPQRPEVPAAAARLEEQPRPHHPVRQQEDAERQQEEAEEDSPLNSNQPKPATQETPGKNPARPKPNQPSKPARPPTYDHGGTQGPDCTPDHVPLFRGWDVIEAAEAERLRQIKEANVENRNERAARRHPRG